MTTLKQKQNRYYLMRHGESTANRQGLIVSHPQNAINDYGLTTKGAEQVMNAALSTRLKNDTVIICSDYKRARETAEIVKSILGCSAELHLEPKLRERDFGQWELTDHKNYETVWRNDISHPQKKINDVETVNKVLERCLSVIEDLENKHRNRTILLVGHGDVLQVLLSYQHNIDPRFHRSLSSIGNADIRSLSNLQLAVETPAA